MQQFSYTVEHKPGKRLGNADGLSRQANYLERKDQGLEELDEAILPPLKETGTYDKPFAMDEHMNDGEEVNVVEMSKEQVTDMTSNEISTPDQQIVKSSEVLTNDEATITSSKD